MTSLTLRVATRESLSMRLTYSFAGNCSSWAEAAPKSNPNTQIKPKPAARRLRCVFMENLQAKIRHWDYTTARPPEQRRNGMGSADKRAGQQAKLIQSRTLADAAGMLSRRRAAGSEVPIGTFGAAL
jgi:hypothetical protein